MKDRPILFSGPMVRALLDGSKTQTRRVVKLKISETLEWFGGKSDADDDRELNELLGQRTEDEGLRVWCSDYPEEGSEVIHCPYGQPGDRLWVREAWGIGLCGSRVSLKAEAWPDGWPVDRLRYAADGTNIGTACVRPSIHMPRWASRITLEVNGVRVERLQDISRGDAMAEGCPFPNMADGDDPRKWYADLWNTINGPGSWDANPWVWVVEFKAVKP